jgi:AAA+ ATPase superfamily predicted ATPase
MIPKPDHIFDRQAEWRGLVDFVSSGASTATLGIVSGRRRQGKSYLLEALTRAADGLYFPAIEATEAESLRLFSDALIEHTRRPVGPGLRDWSHALSVLFDLVRDPVPVVIDQLPFLVKASPSLPSMLQRELGPGGAGRHSRARLLLCGSAMGVMGSLLSGRAPLRGRAGFELLVQPFSYRDAARFWGITDPRLAVLVHAVVGGTPAYRRELVTDIAPADLADFDAWVARTVLNPRSPLFREARYLLAEEVDIRDPALYHSVLAAASLGHTTAGGIANFIGRRSDQLSHPLTVLEDAGLLKRDVDLFRSSRPLPRLYARSP